MNLFPNPVRNGNVTIIVTPDLVGGSVSVYNEQGQKVAESIISGRYTNYHFPWSIGYYTAEFIKGGLKVARKFVITE